MAYLSLSPVSAAIYGVLNVGSVTTLATGGVDEGYIRGRSGPRVWFEVREARDVRGFGTGGLPEVDLDVHIVVPVDAYRGMKLAQDIAQAAIALLRDAAVTVSGYQQCGRVVYHETVPLPGEIIEGVVVNELVARFCLWVEE